jgi:hypothetical protein
MATQTGGSRDTHQPGDREVHETTDGPRADSRDVNQLRLPRHQNVSPFNSK